MKLSPWILGAAAFVPVAGAVIGSHMSTDPIGARVDVTDTLPNTSSVAHAGTPQRAQTRLPDRYAMETPDGVVEVHELAMRGRYQDRYRAADSYDYHYEEDIAAMEAQWDGYALDSRAVEAMSKVAPKTHSASFRPNRPQPEVAHYAAMNQAQTGDGARSGVNKITDDVIEIEVAQPQIGKAKVINVANELASLN